MHIWSTISCYEATQNKFFWTFLISFIAQSFLFNVEEFAVSLRFLSFFLFVASEPKHGRPISGWNRRELSCQTNIFTITYQLYAHSRLICTGVVYPRNVDLVLCFRGSSSRILQQSCECVGFLAMSINFNVSNKHSTQHVLRAFVHSLFFNRQHAICIPSAFHSSLSLKSAC